MYRTIMIEKKLFSYKSFSQQHGFRSVEGGAKKKKKGSAYQTISATHRVSLLWVLIIGT